MHILFCQQWIPISKQCFYDCSFSIIFCNLLSMFSLATNFRLKFLLWNFPMSKISLSPTSSSNLAFSDQVLYLVFGYTQCPPRTKPGFANIPFSRPPTKWKLAIQIVVGLKDLNKIFTGLFGWLWSVWNRLPSHLFYKDFSRKWFLYQFLVWAQFLQNSLAGCLTIYSVRLNYVIFH